MAKFLLLAFRNVFRNRRRTLMTLLMVGGGVAGLLLVGGFFAFMFRGLRESTIRNGLGHIQIFTAEHFTRDEVHVLDTGIGGPVGGRQRRHDADDRLPLGDREARKSEPRDAADHDHQENQSAAEEEPGRHRAKPHLCCGSWRYSRICSAGSRNRRSDPQNTLHWMSCVLRDAPFRRSSERVNLSRILADFSPAFFRFRFPGPAEVNPAAIDINRGPPQR